jgi:capsular exopolysaccharide synthesis family protein
MRSPGPDEAAGTNNASPNPAAGPAPAPGALVRKEASPLAVHGPSPVALSATPNLPGLLSALRRRWRLAFALGLVVAVAASAAVWKLRPITWAARTKLHVASVRPKVAFEVPDAKSDFGNYKSAQLVLVKSRLVLNSALRDPKVAELPGLQQQPDPVAWLEGVVQADFSVGPEFLTISITGQQPAELRVLVTAVREAYLREIVTKENRERLGRLEQLKKLYAEYDGIVKNKKETLMRMARDLGSKDQKLLLTKQEFTLKHISDLQIELMRRQSELRTAQLELTAFAVKEKAAEKATVPETTVQEQINLDFLVVNYLKQVSDREQEVEAFKRRSPNPASEPAYQRAVKILAEAKKALAERREYLGPLLVKQARERIQADLRANRIQQQDKIAFLQEMGRVLEAEINRRSKEVTVLKDGAIDLAWLQDEIAQKEAVSKMVASQIQALDVEIEHAPPRVTELEGTIVTPAQTVSGRFRMAGGAGAGAFAAVLFGIAFLEFRARRVSSVEEVTQGLKMKLVGSLPLVPKRALGRSGGPKSVHWQNRLTESIDAIRTALLNAARFEGLRVVMVTSAVGGEGKTMLSCHLAASLARAGLKTLLLDADLRRPAVHRLFGLSPEPGLGEVLRRQVEAGEAVQAGLVEGLSVIPAGQSGSEAVHALARHGIGQVLEGLKKDYDFIIVDSAPVLPVADSQTIGQHVDGVVFSVMRDVSRLPEVYAACERLAALRVRILGAVVSGTGGGGYGSAYHYASTPAAAKKA